MNWSNFIPPDRTQLPGPSTALNESGSHASSILTSTSCRPPATAVGAPAGVFGTLAAGLDAEGTLAGSTGLLLHATTIAKGRMMEKTTSRLRTMIHTPSAPRQARTRPESAVRLAGNFDARA